MDMEQVFALASFVFMGFMVAAVWKIFTKAGEAGWKTLIPIYNIVVFLRLVGRPWWWLLLMFVPIVNFFTFIVHCIDLSRAFGKGGGFAAGLMLLTPVYLLALGFGEAKYALKPKRVPPARLNLHDSMAA